MKPQKLWVLYGGESTEREVSVRTGTNMVDALKARGFNVRGIELKRRDDLLALLDGDRPDFIVLGLHGTYGEDGRLQGFLDTLAIPYVGAGVLSSALCFNKVIAQRLLQSYGCPVAPFLECTKQGFTLDQLLTREPGLLDKKWFIKAASQGSTIGVFRYDPKAFVVGERAEAFGDFCHKSFQYDDEVIIEEWIEGRELTCAVVLDEAYPLIEIRPNSKFYDYQSKYTVGETEYLCPAPVDATTTQRIQKACVLAYKALRCADYARVDVMMRESNEFFILEVNTLPGMTATSLVPKAAKVRGASFEVFMEELVMKSFMRQKK